MTAPLLIAGSVAIDTIQTPHGSASDQLGGSATFAALAARHWAPNSLILSAIGLDFPPHLLKIFETAKLDHAHLTRDPVGKSFRWTGRYNDDLGTRETVGLELGVMASATLQAPKDLGRVRFAMMGTYHPARQLELLKSLGNNVFIATDTIKAYIDYEKPTLTELYRHTHLVTLNDEELKDYTAATTTEAAVAQIFDLGARFVIVKHGEKGSHLYAKTGEKLEVAAYTTAAKDTTGAGDSYLGALMAILNKRGTVTLENLAEGMRYGSATASITVEAFGIDSLLPATLAEIEKRAQALIPTLKGLPVKV